ncbi:MAG: PD-(D/E)XK nuclease family protein [Anaerolineae bacterium]
MLPDGFVFSQSSLQDYVDCARRFQLRYLEHCRWPAPETADALEFEQFVQRGQAFHRLLRQFYSGVPCEALERVVRADPALARWWQNYRNASPQDLPQEVCETEVALSVAIPSSDLGRSSASGTEQRYRLEARYDLLAGEPGKRWIIVDWKTGQHRSSRSWLQKHLQTRIYPYVLVQAGALFNNGVPIAPQQVEMVYWFAEFPAQPERFSYNEEQFAADAAFLCDLVHEIAVRVEEVFPKTEQRHLCRYCVYRSLCWTDVETGLLAEAEDVEGVTAALEEIDLESIAPIPF